MSSEAGPEPDGRPWVAVCRIDDVPVRYPHGVLLEDEPGVEPGSDRSRICIARFTDETGQERVQGMLDRCPHRDIALSGGLVKDGLLTCPGHFWQFDLVDGHRTDLPEQALSLYPTAVAQGWVWVQLPEEVEPMSMREWLLAQARQQESGPTP